MKRPVLIGITGGIGAGKSTLLDAFSRRGAVVFSADDAVHELYGDQRVIDAVHARWGDRVVAADGRIDRGAIAAIVFTDEAEREWLESLLHPLVGEAWEQFVALHRDANPAPDVIVAEVPLLFEAGLEDRYDATVAITAPLTVRIERAQARDRGDKRFGAERAAAQLPDSEKAARADFHVENTGSIDELDAFAGDVIRSRVRDQLDAERG